MNYYLDLIYKNWEEKYIKQQNNNKKYKKEEIKGLHTQIGRLQGEIDKIDTYTELQILENKKKIERSKHNFSS